MQERPSASVTLMDCGIVSGYSPPCSIVSKRSPDPFMLGSWGRFSGVISSNLWVSFIRRLSSVSALGRMPVAIARTSRETPPDESFIERVSSRFSQTLRCFTFRFGGLLRNDVANGFEALFIIARHLDDVLGEHPHHRDLELYERFDRVEPNGGAGSHPALLFLGHTAGAKTFVFVSPFVFQYFIFAPSRTQPTTAGRASSRKTN